MSVLEKKAICKCGRAWPAATRTQPREMNSRAKKSFMKKGVARNHQSAARWFTTAENRDVSTGPFRIARSLAPLTHSLAPHCSLRSRAPLRSFVCSLAGPFTRSQAHGKEVFVHDFYARLHAVSTHCAPRVCVCVCVCVSVCLCVFLCTAVNQNYWVNFVNTLP